MLVPTPRRWESWAIHIRGSAKGPVLCRLPVPGSFTTTGFALSTLRAHWVGATNPTRWKYEVKKPHRSGITQRRIRVDFCTAIRQDRILTRQQGITCLDPGSVDEKLNKSLELPFIVEHDQSSEERHAPLGGGEKEKERKEKESQNQIK